MSTDISQERELRSVQHAVRLTESEIDRIDRFRDRFRVDTGVMLTRSDVLRMGLDRLTAAPPRLLSPAD